MFHAVQHVASSLLPGIELTSKGCWRPICTRNRLASGALHTLMAFSNERRVAAVAYCADRLMEVPLHVAASSLLRNIHVDYSVRFYLVLTGFSAKAVNRLRRTLELTGREHEVKILDAPDPSLFRGFRPLHGNLTPYHRLILPELVQEPRLLYFDSDTQVRTDVSPLFTLEMGSRAMGFVVDGKIRFALESPFFLSLGASPDDPAFNSGAMLFNLPEWTRQDCSRRIFEFCHRHSDQLLAADQTALTALYGKECFHLENRFNIKVYPAMEIQRIPDGGVIHYVGSPKPWDIGGKLFLHHTRPWWDDLRKTAVPLSMRVPWLSYGAWKRLSKIMGGYRQVARQRYRVFRRDSQKPS